MAVIAASLFVAASASAAATNTPLLLEVFVNGRDTGTLADFVDNGSELLATRDTLTGLGLVLPDTVAPGPETLVPLRDLPGLTYQLDMRAQAVRLAASDADLVPTAIGPGARETGKEAPLTGGTGAALNYDIVTTYDRSRPTMAGSFDSWVFSPVGVLDNTWLAYAGDGENRQVRLDTTYSYSDPDNLRRYRIGDVIAGGLSWTRPVRLGGVQVSTDFALRPDLVTMPLPNISGQAAVPSSVDVLVNGVRQFSANVNQGPFIVPQLPVVNGGGDVSVVVTNALGQQTVTTLPFYASSSLLSTGLSSISLEAGKVRENYSVASDDYDTPMASASVRHGVRPWLTVEGHAEGTPDLGMGGAGITIGVAPLGVISLSAAASTTQGQTGTQYSAGFQSSWRWLSISGSVQVGSRSFRDVAAESGSPMPRVLTRGIVGLSFGAVGSFSMAYTGVEEPGCTWACGNAQAGQPAPKAIPGERVSLVTATYSHTLFANVSVNATVFHDFDQRNSTGFFVGISLPIGNSASASANVSSAGGQTSGQFAAVKPAVSVGEWGWQAEAQQGGSVSQQMGELDYKSPWGLVGVAATRSPSDTAARASMNGALVFADGSLFAANAIADSFAVVDTGSVAGVPVTIENRYAGTTNASGRVLVPDLRSFENNRIGLDPDSMPPDIDVTSTSTEVRPRDRSGALVKFTVRRNRGAVVVLHEPGGAVIPVGSTVVLDDAARTKAVVGYDGETYFPVLGPHNTLTVRKPSGGVCQVTFDFGLVSGQLPRIGPLICQSH